MSGRKQYNSCPIAMRGSMDVIMLKMKKAAIALGLLAIVLTAFVMFQPKAKPSLKTPTVKQLKAAFPNNTKTIFDKSDKFTLLSLDPSWDSLYTTGNNIFHGFRILGQTEVKDNHVRQQLRRLYYDGLADTHFSAACFNPAHGIRTVKDGRTLDLLICFDCALVRVVVNGEKHGDVHWGSTQRAAFDEVLAKANVPLSRK